eukprot:2777296-Pleurochrysis_carterae.AAC.4
MLTTLALLGVGSPRQCWPLNARMFLSSEYVSFGCSPTYRNVLSSFPCLDLLSAQAQCSLVISKYCFQRQLNVIVGADTCLFGARGVMQPNSVEKCRRVRVRA